MAEWITVFCRQPITLDAAEIHRWLDSADLWTLAETFLDDEQAATVAGNLRVRTTTTINVHWKESGRPLKYPSSPNPLTRSRRRWPRETRPL